MPFAKRATLAICLLAGCVAAPQGSSFTPDSGMPPEAVASMTFLNDGEGRDLRTIFLTFYPEKASPPLISAAPTRLCTSIRKRLVHSEYMAHEPNHGGMRTQKLLVRCKS